MRWQWRWAWLADLASAVFRGRARVEFTKEVITFTGGRGRRR